MSKEARIQLRTTEEKKLKVKQMAKERGLNLTELYELGICALLREELEKTINIDIFLKNNK